ncbi:MAG: hypothetical protein AAFX03_06790 [Pseudomonadota bacterium]
MKQVRMIRERGYFGAARALGVYVDGKKVGELMQTKSLLVDIPPGAREIYGKMDWGKTVRYPLAELENGAALKVKLHFTLNPLRLLGMPTLPSRIERAETEADVFV